MSTFGRPFNRFAVVAGVLAVLAMALAAVVLLPGDTLAQTGEPEGAAPPPLSPPAIQLDRPAAAPGLGATESRTANSDVEVVKFRPQTQLVRGQPAALPPEVDKPAGEGQTDVEKPPAGQHTGPQEAYVAPDYRAMLEPLAWDVEMYEGFVGFVPPALNVGFAPQLGTSQWIVEDLSNDGYERSWGANDWIAYADAWSAWPAAAGANALDPNIYNYPNNLYSWMTYGPMDFSGVTDVFVSFGLWYQTEPQYDWVYFCASVDNYHFNCAYWSGDSGGWTDQAYWLTSYAGYSQVWLAWVFEADASIMDDGPFVDEIYVWGDDAAPAPAPTPDPNGQLILNGSFEATPDHLVNWDYTAGVGVADTTYVDGLYSAYLWQDDGAGDDFLSQTFDVPAGVTDVTLNYWFGITTDETVAGQDYFCASLRPAADFGTIWVDLGCMDATETTGYWQELLYALTTAEVNQVAGQTVDLIFEMYNVGAAETWSAGWVDYVRLYATGGGGGEALDPHEPNDDAATATTITCGQTISGTIGDALGGYDEDWFVLYNAPTGQIDVDIEANTQLPPSALDSVVYLYDDSGVNVVAWNDDDGFSYDSYVVYSNTVANATFYISVESYSGHGGPDSFFDLAVQCSSTGGGAPQPGNDAQPQNPDAWTVMLYLNAEDPDFESILTGYRTDIEAFIGSKSTFLNVLILYDGSGADDTTRYLVQPNGSYTDGVNRWHLGELNMGHLDTLADFVTWAMDQYPARNYYLAVDDHGDGAYGISFDGNSGNDPITPPELYSALKSATHNGGRKIDIFDYEACLMGLAENAYDLRQWVDYVVFSEQISWGIDTYPNYFGDLASTDTPLAVGQRIVDRYHAEALKANGGRGYPHTISLIDTSKMTGVSDAVTAFGNALQATGNKNAVNDARDNSQAFAADYDATHPLRAEYIDLWDLADEASGLVSTQATAVKSAVNAAVVHERHASGGASGYFWDHSGAHGLAIYYPPTRSSSAFESYVAPSLYQMSYDGAWDEFLKWVVPSGYRKGMSTSRSQDRLLDDADAFAFRYVYLPLISR